MCHKRFFLILLCLFFVLSCGCVAEKSEKALLLAPAESGTEANIRTAVVGIGDMERDFSASFQLIYSGQSIAKLEEDGLRFSETCVSIGQNVQAGETLAIFTRQPNPVRLKVIELEIKQLSTEQRDADAAREKERTALTEALALAASEEEKGILELRLERSDVEYEQQKKSRQMKKKMLNQEKEELTRDNGEVHILCPADGVVKSLPYMAPGQECAKGQTVAVLYDPADFLLFVQNGYAGFCRYGQEVNIRWHSGKEQGTLKGEVVCMDQMLDVDQRSGGSLIRLDEESMETIRQEVQTGRLNKLEGTVTTAQIRLKNVLLVPQAAVSFEEETPFVYVMKEELPCKRFIQIGPGNGESYVVLSGLQEGQTVQLD